MIELPTNRWPALQEKLTAIQAAIENAHELRVTGSVGILVKASKVGLVPDLNECFSRMHEKGVWISETLQEQALHAVRSN